MKADKIFKNAKIFTADKDHPQAAALAVKDGKFIYVGDEAGLSAYEGEVADLGGKFIMPGKRKFWTLLQTMCGTIPVRTATSSDWRRKG